MWKRNDCSPAPGMAGLVPVAARASSSAIFAAVRVNNIEALRIALEAEGSDINYRSPHDLWSALIRATYDGHLPLVNMLCDSKADLNLASTLGRTALHVAAHCNNLPIANSLLEAKADTSCRDIYDRTALDYARSYGDDTELVQHLKHSQENLKHHSSQGAGRRAGVNLAVELAAEMGSPRRSSQISDNKAALQRLVADKRLWDGEEPQSIDADVLKAIRDESSSDEEDENEGGVSSRIAKASSPNLKERLSVLAQAGPSNKSIKSAALWASAFGKVRALRAVIEVGSDVNQKVDHVSNNTSLHWAVMHKKMDTVRVLLEAGADPTLRNRNGMSPLDIAREMRLFTAVLWMEETPKGREEATLRREQEMALKEIEERRSAAAARRLGLTATPPLQRRQTM